VRRKVMAEVSWLKSFKSIIALDKYKILESQDVPSMIFNMDLIELDTNKIITSTPAKIKEFFNVSDDIDIDDFKLSFQVWSYKCVEDDEDYYVDIVHDFILEKTNIFTADDRGDEVDDDDTLTRVEEATLSIHNNLIKQLAYICASSSEGGHFV
jgi:hypothetical protein